MLNTCNADRKATDALQSKKTLRTDRRPKDREGRVRGSVHGRSAWSQGAEYPYAPDWESPSTAHPNRSNC